MLQLSELMSMPKRRAHGQMLCKHLAIIIAASDIMVKGTLCHWSHAHMSLRSLSTMRSHTDITTHMAMSQQLCHISTKKQAARSFLSDPHLQGASTGLQPVRGGSGLLHVASEGIGWGKRPSCDIPHIMRLKGLYLRALLQDGAP